MGDTLSYPEAATPSADVYVETSRAIGNRVVTLKQKPEDLTVRYTGDSTETKLSAWMAAVNGLTGTSAPTAGTVSASKAVVVDGSKDITGFRHVSMTGNLTLSAGNLVMGATTIGETEIALVDQAGNATAIGAAATVTGTLTTTISRLGNFFVLTFTLTAVEIAVTDGAGSGSYGTTKLFDFAEGAVTFLGSRQNYTAFAEGAALTGGAGDAVFEIGLGTTAISAAADGTLGNGLQENVGQAVAVTLSGGTGTGTAVTGAVPAAVDGTGTAADLNLNWSGTAATIDANSTITVTGTITVVGVFLGDD